MNATIDLQTLFWICSGFAALVAVWKIVRTPFAQVADHERRLNTIEESVKERKETDKAVLKALNAITNHMIDGNGIDKLKASRDELQRTIIDHQK